MKTLYLIDGYAAIFRAFYAIRNPLYSSVTGEPTQAIYVFANMLIKLYTTLGPDYVAVAWDTPGETFRDALYGEYARLAQPTVPVTAGETPPPIAELSRPSETTTPTTADPPAQPQTGESVPIAPPQTTPPADETGPPIVPVLLIPPIVAPTYKGTRRETPNDLNTQVPRIIELLNVFQIPIIGEPQWEADDIIATLTSRILRDPAQKDVRVRIATKDKDMEQLINERVTLFDIHTGAELGETDLLAKRGITPAQVVDFLSLTGDTVDNIPGVPGVGPKTAAKLLQHFGTLDALLQALADPANLPPKTVPDKVRENLELARPTLPLSRRLVTLHPDAEFDFDLERDARAQTLQDIAPAMLAFCDALGFNSLKKAFL